MKSKITDSDNWWPGKEFTVFNQTSNNLILVAGYTGTGVTFNIASNVTIPAGKFVKLNVSADLSSLEVLEFSGGGAQEKIKRNLQSNNINYCGYAPFGSAESSAVWTVTKITVAANGTITKQTFTNVTWSSVPF